MIDYSNNISNPYEVGVERAREFNPCATFSDDQWCLWHPPAHIAKTEVHEHFFQYIADGSSCRCLLGDFSGFFFIFSELIDDFPSLPGGEEWDLLHIRNLYVGIFTQIAPELFQ